MANNSLKLATLCYVQRPGQTLMLHRVKRANDYHEGKWNGLGGKFEPGESPEECVVREVYEESGLVCLDPSLRGQITFPNFDGEADWYVWLFLAPDWTGELRDSLEGRLAWIDNDRLLDLNLWPGDRLFIPWLFEDRFFSAKFLYEGGEFQGYEATFYEIDGRIERVSYEHRDKAAGTGFVPIYEPVDDTFCWLCGSGVTKRHCKIICTQCGFTRDCSDP